MQTSVQITFRGLDHSEAVEELVRKEAARLDGHFDRIVSCRVVIEATHRQQQKAKIFHVRIDLGVPGAELVANRDPAEPGAHSDPALAVRDAFRVITRQLQDYVSRHRHQHIKVPASD